MLIYRCLLLRFFGFTLLLSYVMYISIEPPFIVLETMLMPKSRASSKPESPVNVQVESTTETSKVMPTAEGSTDMEKAATSTGQT